MQYCILALHKPSETHNEKKQTLFIFKIQTLNLNFLLEILISNLKNAKAMYLLPVVCLG